MFYRHYWFKKTYDSGHTETVCVIGTSLRAEYERQLRTARDRVTSWRHKPGWRRPPVLVRLDVIQQPADLTPADRVYLQRELAAFNA